MTEVVKSQRVSECMRQMAKNSVPPTRPLYKPGWQLYGRSKEPLGSLYDTSPVDGPWLVFDQVLISADLIGDESHDVVLVTEANGVGLLTMSIVKRPDKTTGSDHLPLVSKFII